MPTHIMKYYLFQKQLCPYNFNPKQFDQDLHQVLEMTSENKMKSS